MKTLTISVAAYNIEKYIADLLNHITEANCINDVEVLIIDDGGTDKTAEIANTYCTRFPDSIKFIHKENGGWGSTVNTGINSASGKYFKLLDGDDYISAKELDALVCHLKQVDADMIYSAFRVFNEGGTVNVYSVPQGVNNNTVDQIKDLKADIYPRMHSVVFRTDILKENHIAIPEHCFYTDVEYVFRTLQFVKTINFFDGITYNYRISRDGQSVSVPGLKKHYSDHVAVVKRMIDISTSIHVSEKVESIYQMRVRDLIEAQYIIFWKIGKEHWKDYENFDEFLKQYPAYYHNCSKQVKASRIFNKCHCYGLFVSLFNRIKPNASI